jgi:hypothetical protein
VKLQLKEQRQQAQNLTTTMRLFQEAQRSKVWPGNGATSVIPSIIHINRNTNPFYFRTGILILKIHTLLHTVMKQLPLIY